VYNRYLENCQIAVKCRPHLRNFTCCGKMGREQNLFHQNTNFKMWYGGWL